MISDQDVAATVALLEDSGVAGWIEGELCARRRRPGRPRQLSVLALLTALLLLAIDDRALHLTAATDVLYLRISDAAKVTWACGAPSVDTAVF